MERAQRIASAGAAGLRAHADELTSSLGKLAFADIALQGLGRAGRAINDPLRGSVERQAEFSRKLTGLGIMADIPQAQLPAVGRNIVDLAQRTGLPIDTIMEDEIGVENEGVYKGKQLVPASRAAANISLLADITGSPLQGSEAAALVSTYAHTLGAPAARLDHLNAMVFRASQLGGDRIGNVARYLPTIMAQMKGRAFGNEDGLADVLAALQVVKRVAGSDDQAGTDLRDYMAGFGTPHEAARFKKQGIDIEKVIAQAHVAHVSPLRAIAEAVREKIGADQNDPKLAGKLGKFFGNQWAGQAALALLQYQGDGPQGLGMNTFRAQIKSQSAQDAYHAAIARGTTGSFADRQRATNARDAAGIATGGALAPVTRLSSAVQGGLFGAVDRLMSGMGGPAVAAAAAGIGAVASGAAAAGNAVVGVIAPMIIFKSLTGKLLPDLGKLVGGKGLGAVAGVLESVGGAFAAATAPAAAFAAALLANPITWIVAAVIALGVAAFVIVKNWGPISHFFMGIWDKIKAPIAGALSFITKLLMDWTPLGFIVRLGAVLARGVVQLGGALAGPLKAAFGGFLQVAGIVGSALSAVSATVGAGLLKVGGLILAFTPVGSLIRAFQAVWPWLQAQVPRFMEAGGHIIAGLARGLLAGVFAVHDALRKVGDGMIDGLKVRLGIHSPSRVFAELGEHTVAGLVVGIGRRQGDAVRLIGELAAGVMAAGAITLALPAIAASAQPPPAPRPLGAVTLALPAIASAAQPPLPPRPLIRTVPYLAPVVERLVRPLTLAPVFASTPEPRQFLKPPQSVAAVVEMIRAPGRQQEATPVIQRPAAERPAERRAPANVTVHNTFNIDGKTDVRQFARSLSDLQQRGLRAALHDIEDGA